MTNYREILRLHSLGLNKTEIATSCRCARNTVATTLQRAANCGLQWPLPEGMSDKEVQIVLKSHMPEDESEASAKCFLPDILDFFESKEGR